MPLLDVKKQITNQFSTPPPNKHLLSPKSLCRKPSFGNFGRKKHEENYKQVDRIRFISPTKTNFLITDQTEKLRQSLHMSIMNESNSTDINYPLIKRCVSPRHGELKFQSKISINSSYKFDQSSVFSCILSPSINYFQQNDTNQFPKEDEIQKMKLEIKQLKKDNFDLNLSLDQKSELLQKQKKDYDQKLQGLDKYLAQIKNDIENYEIKAKQSHQKLIKTQSQNKELEKKLEQITLKLDKSIKQNKMYKAKFRTNINKDQKQQASNRKYHQNCGKVHNDSKNTCCKSTLMQTNKTNQILPNNPQISSSNQVGSQNTIPSLKKIKSQNSLNILSQKSILFQQNKEDQQQYYIYKMKIQSLLNEIRYREIQISTLRKTKLQYEDTKKKYQKIKVFNRRLLTQVDHLTKQCDQYQNMSGPMRKNDLSPTKVRKNNKQFEDIESSFEFELSPQKKQSQLQIEDCLC